MSRAKGATTTTSPTRVKSDLLARLGLDAAADDQEVEATHDQIVEYLEGAPTDIRGWADRRQQEVDRVFALLTGPESELRALARPSGAGAAAETTEPNRTNRMLVGIIAVLVTIGVVLGVYWMGKPDVPEMTTAQDTSQTQTAAAVDPAKLAELTKKVEANPKDIASLQGIADLYFGANDWANAKAFSQKALDIDPKNAQALISLGAAAYNSGDNATAEKTWKAGVAAHPDNAELHYDLGFLYMTTGRSDLMQSEWKKVVEIDPNSELAKTVQSQVGDVTKPSGQPTTTK
ncbi:tetratricopeptide repeat protein [Intrasporangium calvum]|uniref:tetratricopeptide repeat protein n=1 Tax=Intrasporangium calvum TaxID=53358 RepID=UPI0019006419|nr:tetratricopeptide repeat protein [Intrasporangium calvum]